MSVITWEQYKNQVYEMTINEKERFIFRGHSNDVWKLETSLYRAVKAAEGELELKEFYTNSVKKMQQRISTLTDTNTLWDIDKDIFSFLSYLQHHGYPTPLLDFTYSPYIAAFFAAEGVCCNNPASGRMKIFAIDTSLLEQTEDFYLTLPEEISGNYRLLIQQGVFVNYLRGCVGEYFKELGKEGVLLEFSISVKERNKIIADLNLMGINAMTLFPGVEGICRQGREEFFPPKINMTREEYITVFESIAKRLAEDAKQFNPYSHEPDKIKEQRDAWSAKSLRNNSGEIDERDVSSAKALLEKYNASKKQK